jgi:hypothetical protein
MKIVFCIPGREFCSGFFMSFCRTLIACTQAGHEVVISNNYSSCVHFARAKVLGYNVLSGPDQKPFQGKLEYDVQIWLDSDIVFRPEDVLSLIETHVKNPDMKVIAAPYIMEDIKHYAAVKDWDLEHFAKNGTFQFLTPDAVEQYRASTHDRFMDVAYCGMGFMLIAKGVLEDGAITYPPFWRDLERIVTGNEEIPLIVDMSSEDVALCKNLKDAGFKIWLDTTLRVGHHKSLTL